MADADTAAGGLLAAITTIFILLLASAATTTSPIQTRLKAEPSTLDWGELHLGLTATRTVTLTNTGNTTSEPLNMTHTCSVGTVTWDAEGETVTLKSSVLVTFSLTVFPNASQGHFAFNITISG